jgi:hypothetical protein
MLVIVRRVIEMTTMSMTTTTFAAYASTSAVVYNRYALQASNFAADFATAAVDDDDDRY